MLLKFPVDFVSYSIGNCLPFLVMILWTTDLNRKYYMTQSQMIEVTISVGYIID